MGESQKRYKGKRSKTGGVNNNKPSKPKAWVDASKDWEPQGDYTGLGSGDGGPGKYPSGTKSTGKSKGGKGGGKGGGSNGGGTGRTKAEKWAAAAEATGKLADVAGDRAKASKAGYSVSGTKVRSNNASSYNYQPTYMSQKESTTPMVRFDSDYEKEKKRLGLS